MQKLLFFGGLVCCFWLVVAKTLLEGFFDDYEKLIFRFLVNVAGSITWPPQGQ